MMRKGISREDINIFHSENHWLMPEIFMNEYLLNQGGAWIMLLFPSGLITREESIKLKEHLIKQIQFKDLSEIFKNHSRTQYMRTGGTTVLEHI